MPATIGSSLQAQATHMSVLLFGPEGTGKTTNALRMAQLCKKDQRVMLIDAEGGAKVEALRQRGVDVARIEVWPDDGDAGRIKYDGLLEVTEHLRANAAEYVGSVWDSGTEITRRILDDVTQEARDKDARLGKARGRFQVNLEDHGVASSQLRDLLRRYRDLPMHLVITALERRDVDQDSGKVKYGPAMSPAMANDAAGLVDIVGYTEVESVGDVEVRSARFIPTPTRRAKDRYGLLPGKLADPYFDRLFAYVKGDLTKDKDPIQQRVREMHQALIAAANGEGVDTKPLATAGATAKRS